jgi:exonuclease VII small subunit
MEEANNLTYDMAVKKAEQIIVSLEQTEALDMTEYKKRAAEVNQLLAFCESQLRELDRSLHSDDH